ncbi:MAG: zinc-dependent peptidase [Nitrospirales bacterium]|nr:zinc-dependent peptidase [Nitrospiraceae bacterium]MDR4486580.1 zinc-dependent peptidase [Nitrospirales bacterium]
MKHEAISAPSAANARIRQEHLTRILSGVLSAVIGILALAVSLPLRPSTIDWATRLALILPGGLGFYYFLTRRLRQRAAIRQAPFPDQWRKILEQEVPFYQTLNPAEQQRFREEVHIFLQEKRITGIRTTIDDTVKLLVAASAIIPIFGFPGWEWDQIREILIYPHSFNDHYQTEHRADASILGMVGSGAMTRMMILSKPELLQGFRQPQDRHNVGIHEFTHLLDKSDGVVDGIPEVALPARAIKPWLELVRREMENIRQGHSDINPYGLTNEAEFFAVAAEYFFEHPEKMHQHHPCLYDMLRKIFRQDPQSRLSRAISDMFTL